MGRRLRSISTKYPPLSMIVATKSLSKHCHNTHIELFVPIDIIHTLKYPIYNLLISL